ncbi:hypothetical protein JCM5353_001422 [Sporobolomyces roseus]
MPAEVKRKQRGRPRSFSNVGQPSFSLNLDPLEESPDRLIEEAGKRARQTVDAQFRGEGERRKEFADYLQEIVNRAVEKGDCVDVMSRWKSDYEQFFRATNKSRRTLNRMKGDRQLDSTRREVMYSSRRITKKVLFGKPFLELDFRPEAVFDSILASWEEEIEMDLVLLGALAISQCEEKARHACSMAANDTARAIADSRKDQQLTLLEQWQRGLKRELLVYLGSARDTRLAAFQIKYEICRLTKLFKDGQPPLFRNEALNDCFKVESILARVRRWEVLSHETSISHRSRIGRRVAAIEGVRHSGEAGEEGGLYF